jgi:hypothetical protein
MNTQELAIRRDENGDIVNITLRIQIGIREKDDLYSVYSPSFETYGYSKASLSAAIKDLEKALAVFFKLHIRENTLDAALEYFGWNLVETTYQDENTKHLNAQKIVEIEVPVVAMAA